MRIAFVSGAHIPSQGANSMHVMRMCQAMARLGHEVTLHARPGDSLAEDDFAHYGVEPGFRIVKTPRPNIRVWGAIVNAWRTSDAVLLGQSPDLIYAREFWALMLQAKRGIPFVFESHWKPRSSIHKAVQRYIMRQTSFRKLVVISNGLRKIYEAEFPELSPRRICVAHDGADPVKPYSMGAPLFMGRRNTLQVGYVGSFQTGAGVEFLAELARSLPDMDFHVVGGEAEDVRVREAGYAVVTNLSFHGFVAPWKLPSIYASLDVALAPYQSTTRSIDWISPMKLFEYMAHGKAIVCSDFPVMREIITNGKDGLLVRSCEIAGWRDALLGLRDSGLRRRLGQAAKEKLECCFTWDMRAKAVLGGISA